MRVRIIPVAMALAALALAGVSRAGDTPPPWAFVVVRPGASPAPDDGRPKRVPGSAAAFTLTQIRDLFNVPDWHPGDHPAMPAVVAHGRAPALFACGYCHLPNGLGRPENASLAGLPVDYIVQQVADFESGARKSSEPASLPANAMTASARAATHDEVKAAAEYFGALRPKPWIEVVEADRVPATHAAGWMLVRDEPAATEPIGLRIIELPQDLERTELRDAASGFVAYVPVGSVEKGKALAAGGKITACALCHGAGLEGRGSIPGLGGRSPSYMVRQLYDFQHGARNGPAAGLMKPVVAKLTLEDMVSLAAYTASLAP